MSDLRHTDNEQPMCGASVVYRWIEGHPADLRVCERTAGPCPHPPAARSDSRFDAPCAAIHEEASDG